MPTSVVNEIWTAEKIEALKTLWRDGVTASNIGLQLGCTKNAVLGKVHKLKLASRRAKQNQPKAQQRAAGKANADRVRASRSPHGRGLPQPHHVAAKRAEHKPAPILPFDVEDNLDATDVTHLLGIMDLQRNSCRWPMRGEGRSTLFCGREAHHGPYCPDHSKRAGAGYGRGARP